MKREYLKGLNIEGLTDEIIENIMKENGKDIEATKAKLDKSQELENLQSQLKEKEQLINESNAQIEKFKTLDIDGIKAQAEEWKNKYSEFEIKSKADAEAFAKQLADKDYEFTVKEIVGQHKFESEWAKEQFTNTLKSKGFKLEEGKLLGADDYIKDFSEKNKGIFVTEAPNEPIPQIVKGIGGQNPSTSNNFGFNFTPVRPIPKE